MKQITPNRVRLFLIGIIISLSNSGYSQELTELDEIHFSADIHNSTPGSGPDIYSYDDSIIRFDIATGTSTTLRDLGDLDSAEIDAYHNKIGDNCGETIYSLDTSVIINGTAMRPADVFDVNGNKVLDAVTANIPSSVNVDAISRDPLNCDLLISIDSTAMLNNMAFKPDDIIRYSGNSNFSLYQATNFNANIDALHLLAANRMLISLEITRPLPDLDAGDHEIIEIQTSGDIFQLLAFTPAAFNDSWQAADLNALWASKALQAGTIQWEISQVYVTEGDVSIDLIIERIDGSEGAINVNYSTIAATATAGDFTAINSNVTIPDGDNSAQISVQINNDNQIEGAEYFSVRINSVTGNATIGSPSTIRVDIRDDEDYIFSDGFE